MEKNKIVTCVLAAGLALSLVGNGYLWYAANQSDTEYIAAIAGMQAEISQDKEIQDALNAQLEQAKAELEQTKSELEQAKKDLETAQEEIDELMEKLKDTSGAPTVDDLKKAEEEAKQKEQESQGQGSGQQQGGGQGSGQQGQTGQTGGQQGGGQGSGSKYTKEELLKILEEAGGYTGDGSQYDNGGATHDGSGDLPTISWNK